MMEIVSVADFNEEEITRINSLSPLEILAFVAEKDYEKQRYAIGFRKLRPSIDMPMSEKKPLPFNLNLKPRSYGKPRSTPIDIDAVLPCLHMKRKNELMGNDGKSPAPKRIKFTIGHQPVQPDLATEYRQRIAELGGSDPELVIQKTLYLSDVLPCKSRLTIPYRQCKVEFGDIGEMQVRVIYKGGEKEELSEMSMTFKKWDTVSSYVFNGNWNTLVGVCGLQGADVVQVWSFRVAGELNFALVKL